VLIIPALGHLVKLPGIPFPIAVPGAKRSFVLILQKLGFSPQFARKMMKGILEHAQIGDRTIKNPVSWPLSKLNFEGLPKKLWL